MLVRPPYLQPDLLTAVLALLPPGLASLEIHASRCAGPLLGLIGRRFPQLARLVLTGNAAQLDWDARGAAAAVPLLVELQLTYCWPTYEFEGSMSRRMECDWLSDNDVAALAPATRLHSLDLTVESSPALSAAAEGCPQPARPQVRPLHGVLGIALGMSRQSRTLKSTLPHH